ncbi:MAG: leucine-rich repeat protein, partial [Propionibacteriaceae bacterium]|nr:leucine-rich repeat protein [Propionibacteriaceae bacterium]
MKHLLRNFKSKTVAISLAFLIALTGLNYFSSGGISHASSSDYLFDAGTGTIEEYLGSDTSPAIPDQIDDVEVKAIGQYAFRKKGLTSVTIPDTVSEIGKNAFAENSLTSVSLPDSLTEIGSSAFAYNKLNQLIIPGSVFEVGSYAFRDNALSELSLGDVSSIGAGAFMNNRLSDVTLPSTLTTIGDSAFELNNFSEVAIPDSVTSYGDRVFANNGRYVVVSGDAAKTYSIDGAFGEIKDPATLTVKYEANGESVRSSLELATDVDAQVDSTSKLLYVGNEYRVEIPQIDGYVFQKASGGQVSDGHVTLTLKKETTITFEYADVNTPPTFTGLVPLQAQQGSGDITKEKLLEGVGAKDVAGNELSEISVTPETVPTDSDGMFTVTYSVTDTNGNTATAERAITVGKSMEDFEVGNGWLYKDFAYDGTTLVGLSATGTEKLKTNTAVVIPGINPYTGQKLTVIGTASVTGGTSLETASKSFSSLTFSAKTDGVVEIKKWAFDYYNGTGLDLSPLTGLKIIGEQAFYKYAGTGTDLVLNYPGSKIEEVRAGAFHNFVGNSIKIDGMSQLRVLKMNIMAVGKQTYTGSAIDFTTLTSLEEIGSTFQYWKPSSDYVLDLSKTKIKDIPEDAFAAANPDDVILPETVETIGARAFRIYVGSGQELDFSHSPNLTSIGVNAFSSFRGTKLDFHGLQKMTGLPAGAFGSFGEIRASVVNPEAEIDITDMPNLEYIGTEADESINYVFPLYNGKTVFDFTQYPKLKVIGSGAFRNYTGENAGNPTIVIPSTVERIDSLAFTYFAGQMDFSKAVNLQSIGAQAFTFYTGGAPDWSALKSLKTIGTRAFRALPLGDVLDLSGTKLETIGAYAFTVPDNGIVYLPDTISALAATVFTGDLDSSLAAPTSRVEHSVFAYTGSNKFTSDAKSESGNSNSYLYVNKIQATAIAKDAQGNVLKRQVVALATEIGKEIQVKAPTVIGYTLDDDATKAVTPTALRGTEVTFKYSAETPTKQDAISLHVDNLGGSGHQGGNSEYQIGADMPLEVALQTSEELNAGTVIYVPLYANAQVTAVSDSSFITSWKQSDGYLKITLAQIPASTQFAFQFTQKWAAYRTPWGHSENVTAFIQDGTSLLATAVDGAVLTGTENTQPVLTSYINGLHGQNLNTELGLVNPGSSYVLSAKDVTISYKLTELKRQGSSFTVSNELPLYTDREGVTQRASFSKEANPGWVLDAETNTVSYEVVSSGTTYPTLPELKLTFPNAATDQQIANTAKLVIQTAGWEQQAPQIDPESFTVSDTNRFKHSTESALSVSFTKLADGTYIYDDAEDLAAERSWSIDLTASDKPVSDVTVTDSGLDARMEYAKISVPAGADWKLKGYAGSDKILDETVTEPSYTFSKAIAEQLTSFVISFDGELSGDNKATVYAKFRDPDSVKLGESDQVCNTAQASFTSQYGVLNPVSTGCYTLKAVDNTMGAEETATVQTSPFTSGGLVDYRLYATGERALGANPNAFTMVELLSPDVEVVSVTPSKQFLNSPNASYTLVDNYGGSGRTAVVFSADQLSLSGTGEYKFNVATVRAKLGYTLTDSVNQLVTDDVYADSSFRLLNTYENPNVLAGRPLAHGSVQSQAIISKGFQVVKAARSGDAPYSSVGSTVRGGQDVDYQLRAINTDEGSRSDIVFYDVFPQVGDTLLDLTGPAGSTMSRGSEYAMTLDSDVTVSEPGYTVYYATDISNSRTDLLDASKWSTEKPADLTTVKAIKVAAMPFVQLASGQSVYVNFKLKAPANPGGLLDEARAWNSASWTSSLESGLFEGNKVYTEITGPTATVVAHKESEDGKPLAGALLQLKKAGSVVATAITKADGLATFTAPVAEYSISELSAPEGYEVTADELNVTRGQLADGFQDAGTLIDAKSPVKPEPATTGTVVLRKVDAYGDALPGATFTLAGDGVELRRITNSDGKAEFTVPLGEYNLVETAAPGHLETDKTVRKVTLAKADETVDLGNIANPTSQVTLVNIGLRDSAYKALANTELDAAMGERLAGTEFSLYYANELVDTAVTDAKGTLSFSGLDAGKSYLLVEDVQSGWIGRGTEHCYSTCYANSYLLQVNADGSLRLDGQKVITGDLVIGDNAESNDPYLLINTVDQNGTPLAGVTYYVPYGYVYLQGTSSPEMLSGRTFTTDSNGQLLFTLDTLAELLGKDPAALRTNATVNLTIVEKAAPNGHYLTGTYTFPFNYNSAGNGLNESQYGVRTVVNPTSALDVYKYQWVSQSTAQTRAYLGLPEDADNGQIELAVRSNAALRLVDVGGEKLLQRGIAGATVQVSSASGTFTGKTDALGLLDTSTLKLSATESYTVKETKAPSGFKLNKTAQSFTVTDYTKQSGWDGVVRLAIEGEPTSGQLVVTKLSSGGDPLPGVTFELAGADKTRTLTTDASGLAVFSSLPFGTYTLTETATVAGHRLNTTVETVEISAEEPVQYRLWYNEEIVTPEARGGDEEWSAKVIWDDDSDASGIRPSSVVLTLGSGGAWEALDAAASVDAEQQWSYLWQSLPSTVGEAESLRKENPTSDEPIDWEVSAQDVEGYVAEVVNDPASRTTTVTYSLVPARPSTGGDDSSTEPESPSAGQNVPGVVSNSGDQEVSVVVPGVEKPVVVKDPAITSTTTATPSPSATANSGSLPYTGSDLLGAIGVAMGIILLGAATVFGIRMR